MKKLMVGLLLIMLMSVGSESYACEWVRSRLVHQPVVYQVPVAAAYAGPIYNPPVVYEPVVVPIQVWVPVVPVVPVVERRWWGWPNYYAVPNYGYIRPTYIRY